MNRSQAALSPSAEFHDMEHINGFCYRAVIEVTRVKGSRYYIDVWYADLRFGLGLSLMMYYEEEDAPTEEELNAALTEATRVGQVLAESVLTLWQEVSSTEWDPRCCLSSEN